LQKGYPYKRGTEGVSLQERDRRGILTREGQKGYPYKRGTEGLSLQERDRRGVLTREALLYYFMLSFNENNDKKYNLQ
jgi:hypothetical protein